MRSAFLSVIFLFILAFRFVDLFSQAPGSGLYVIWYQDNKSFLDVPFITGGQVVVQWKDVNPNEGVYDFSSISRELQFLKGKKKMTTIQINGNLKPDWLFKVIPYYPGKLSVQVRDEKGTLMYWHPVHLRAYLEMLGAFGSFLEKCEDRDAVLGIRMNFNAIGTEHMNVPVEVRDLKNWIIPYGDAFAAVEWTQEHAKDYETKVVNTFIEKVAPHIKIFVRNNIKPDIEEQYREYFNDGRLAWFHTSSEAEPHSSGTEIQYRRFIEDCRSGKTVGYAEPWASAWGDHGNPLPDDRWCSPPQWNYWRLLLDLHCGVSFIALYANDLNVAITGKYAKKYDESRDKLGYMEEFTEAFGFAHKYAGLHASPGKSPGAWIAFRGNDTILAKNGIPPERRKLSYLTGDYNFLAERLPDKTKAVNNIGPAGQRFGAWARLLPAGESIKIRVDEQFANSIKKASIKIIFYNPERKHNSSFMVVAGGTKRKIDYHYTGRWETAAILLPEGPLTGDDSHIIIRSGQDPLYFHMVEIIESGRVTNHPQPASNNN